MRRAVKLRRLLPMFAIAARAFLTRYVWVPDDRSRHHVVPQRPTSRPGCDRGPSDLHLPYRIVLWIVKLLYVSLCSPSRAEVAAGREMQGAFASGYEPDGFTRIFALCLVI